MISRGSHDAQDIPEQMCYTKFILISVLNTLILNKCLVVWQLC